MQLSDRLTAAVESGDALHIPFTCVGEFWRTMTEPRGYAFSPDHVQLLLRRALRLMPPLMPSARFTEQWLTLASRLSPKGAAIFDVQIAALCLHHRVTELWTLDRQFPAVDGLRVVSPLEP